MYKYIEETSKRALLFMNLATANTIGDDTNSSFLWLFFFFRVVFVKVFGKVCANANKIYYILVFS